ncbi:MAG: YoaK family protein [Acidimicrobiales bacterium]
MSHPSGPPQPLLMCFGALTVVSGFVDAVSYLGLGHVFTANMTGNVVLIGFALAGAPGFSATASLCALGCFLAGAFVGGRLGLHVKPQRTLLLVALVFEATFTTVAAIVAGTVPAIGSGWPRFTVIALLAFAMGVRNAAVRHFGVADMTTTVLTMTLTGLASDSSLAGGTNPHAGRRVASALCMFGGALAGAALVIHVHPAWALATAAFIVVCTTVYFAREAPLELGVAT